MILRSASKDDHAAVRRLALQVHAIHFDARPDVFRDSSRLFPLDFFEGIVTNPTYCVLVATIDDAVVGFTIGQLAESTGHPVLQDRRVWAINDLCVDSGHRRKGIGKALMEAIIAEGTKRSVDAIELNVWTFNEAAHEFHRSLGFQDRNTRMEMRL